MRRCCGVALLVVLGVTVGSARAEPADSISIICSKDSPFAERLASKEVRRYIYLRTGRLSPLLDSLPAQNDATLIVVGEKNLPAVQSLLSDAELATMINSLAPEQYAIKTVEYLGRPAWLIVGGDSIGTLYGAYRFAEHLGVRFYLHGDVIPDERIPLKLPALDECGKPLFHVRGILPFHDFPEGPDWWSRDGYKAILGQLPKMGMNFFGLHTYPEGNVGPEPLVWIGTPDEVVPDGKVKASYPARHYTARSTPPAWGYEPGKTSDFVFGAAEMFDRDDYGADYMRDTHPWKEMSPEQCNALFDRMGEFLDDVFTYARHLGIKTCIGTETPLTVPTVVKQRLQAAGKNPADPAVVQELYEGMFQRIAKTHPLDYYWLWTPEGWTWEAVKQEQIAATVADFRAFTAAAQKVKVPFTLATCGWVLGPPQNPALFDEFLPKDMPMGCINRTVGNTPVEPGFAKVRGRPKWAIPWLEDDVGMTIPQLWVGRMRKDAADALKYGCTGLMGIHWRTRILAPNASALAKAAWDQSGWSDDEMQATAGPQTKKPEGVEGGQVAHFPANAFANTEDATLYQTVRYDVKAYHIDIPNGSYRVTLQLCEPAYAAAGKRVFGAKVQGKMLFEHLDIFAKVGQNHPIDLSANDASVTDGRLVVEFVYENEYPCIAGIVIDGEKAASNQFPSQPYQRKINCGGPAYKEYEADLPILAGSGKSRFLPVADFYADWARSEFGSEAAEPIAALFTQFDGHLPRPADWVTGPGSIRPDERPWTEVLKEYTFVDELAAMRPRIVGPGNLERFNYWLNNFRCLRSVAQVRCVWAQFNQAIGKVKAENDPQTRKSLARELALPLRKELVASFAEMHRHLLTAVTNPGEMGNVCNWQQQTLPVLVTAPGKELAALLGENLPSDAVPSKYYAGEPRLFVPEVRTGIVAGETLHLTAIVLGVEPQTVEVRWRPLGAGPFAKAPLAHVARGVYAVSLPAESVRFDFEYYVQATAGNKVLVFPATAPAMNQTVVVAE